VPLLSPEIEQVVAGLYTVQVAPPGEAVTTYEVAGPPLPLPGTTVIVALASPATTVGAAGVFGAFKIHCADINVFAAGIVKFAPAA